MVASKLTTVERVGVDDLSLLITVKGSDNDLRPYMLCGHMDVVPVVEDLWTVPPFDGLIKDGYIYGRGAIDIKPIVMGVMEALELLIDSDFQPTRCACPCSTHLYNCIISSLR